MNQFEGGLSRYSIRAIREILKDQKDYLPSFEFQKSLFVELQKTVFQALLLS